MSVFETLREEVDLLALAERYAEMQPSGRAYVGRCPCPDHEDNDPSFHVYPDRRFRCYGCGRHGDVVDLWALANGVELGLAAALDLAKEFEIVLPAADAEAQRQAEERRRLEAKYLAQAEKVHSALARHPDVAEWWEGRGFDEGLRRRFLLGAAEGAAIIPFWNGGRVQSFVRRNLEGSPKYRLPKAEEFVRGHRPLFVPGPVRATTFLVEGYVDALALAALGYPAIAVGGTGISERQAEELARIPGPLYVLPDADEPGEKAARVWVEELYPKALLCPPRYEKEGAEG